MSAVTAIQARAALGLGLPIPDDICEVTIPEYPDRRELRHILSLLDVDPKTVPLLFRAVDAGFEVEPQFRRDKRTGWHKAILVSFGGHACAAIRADGTIDAAMSGVILALAPCQRYAEALEPLRDVWETPTGEREVLDGY